MTITTPNADAPATIGRLSWKVTATLAVVAWYSFELAYEVPNLSSLMLLFLICLCGIARSGSARQVFYLGLILGMAVYAPQLAFFRGIFGWASIAIWAVAAVWLALFLLLARSAIGVLRGAWCVIAIAVLWTGLEYFRSELYYLRFAWLTPGFAFSHVLSLQGFGVYGLGFVLAFVAAGIALPPRRKAIITAGVSLILLTLASHRSSRPTTPTPAAASGPFVVGIQAEGKGDRFLLEHMNAALGQYPQLDLIVLGEYSFFGPIPTDFRNWCRERHKYLIAGGTEPVPGQHDQYWNTAYVIGPDGEVAFKQGKSVPIQFFADGLPAPKQDVWNSPWGRIGLCICYDLSYSRVTDRLVRMGAQALIAPTMDVKSWGEHEHRLHARIGPARAEYHVPIVRVCTSGVSQIITAQGEIIATAPYPGQGEMVAGRIELQPGHLPLDRYLAPICVGLTGLLVAGLIVRDTVSHVKRRRIQATQTSSQAH